jgi:hypothetical protein
MKKIHALTAAALVAVLTLTHAAPPISGPSLNISGNATIGGTATINATAVTGTITAGLFSGPLTGNVNGNITGTAPAGTLTGSSLAAGITTAAGLTTAAGGAFGTGAYATISDYMPKAGATFTGHVLFTDNTFDIGASGATRPRTGYFATSVITPLVTATTLTGAGGGITLNAAGFDGNLDTSDDTLQEVAQKLDDLVAGSGAVATDTIWDAAGDLAVGTGANAAGKLTMGTALQVLRVNSGATALEWAASGAGDVTGAASNTANAIPGFSGTGGKTLQNTTLIYNSGALSGFSSLTGASGDLAIGTTGTNQNIIVTPQGTGALNVITQSTGTERGILGSQYSATADAGANLILRRAKGTLGAETAVQSGDSIGALGFRAYHTSWPTTSNAFIEAIASQNQTSSARGAHLEFYTIPNSTSTAARAMRIAESGAVSIGSTSAANAGASLRISSGALGSGGNALEILGTVNSGSAQSAVLLNITGSAAGANSQRAFNVEYGTGYNGSSLCSAGRFLNTNVGTGTQLGGLTSGNIGSHGTVTATTTGSNAGLGGFASGGNISAGVTGSAVTDKNSATNIGMLGFGLNGGTTPVQIGGAFLLRSTNATYASAALLADNGSQTDPIFLARDNGTAVLTIADGGTVTATGIIATTTKTPAALGAAATTFAVTGNVQKVTGNGGGNTIATITGGVSGMVLTLIFVDALVTITDDATAAANTVNLSGAFTSTAADSLTLVHDGTSWIETARSVN